MSETPGIYNVGEKPVRTDDFLSEAEVIVQSRQGQTVKIEQMIAMLERFAASNPGREVEYWIKLL